MEKYIYLVVGFVLSVVSVSVVGLVTGVPGACVYVNSCEPDPAIQRLRNEITDLNQQINQKNDEIVASTTRIIELQNKARVSLDGAKEIIKEVQSSLDPTMNTLELIKQYVIRQKEIERHVSKILCVHQPDLVAPDICAGG